MVKYDKEKDEPFIQPLRTLRHQIRKEKQERMDKKIEFKADKKSVQAENRSVKKRHVLMKRKFKTRDSDQLSIKDNSHIKKQLT